MSERCPTCGQPMPTEPTSLLSYLRGLRKARKLTLRQVGELLVPPRSTAAVSDMETGHNQMSVGTLRQLATIYEADPMELARWVLHEPTEAGGR